MADREVLRRYYTVPEIYQKLDKGTYVNAASHNSSMDRWAGVSWKDSLHLIKDGWKEGAAKLDVQVNPEIRDALRVKPVVGFKGSKVDMGRYMAGRPDSMRSMKQKYRPSSIVRIGVDMCVNGGVDQRRIFAVGKTVLTLVESLRFAGIPAEIWACAAVKTDSWGGSNYVMDSRVKVQEVNKPLDMSRVSYWIGHPGLLRRTFFGLWEQESETIRDKFGFYDHRGYGSVYSNYARDDFDEWAPSAQTTDATLQKWASEVLTRRIAGRHNLAGGV